MKPNRTFLTIFVIAAVWAAVPGKGLTMDEANDRNAKGLATFGGGCFWCLEAVFEELAGVTGVVSGYAGGTGPATYEQVCTGRTGHAEVVQVEFDPGRITYRQLLAVFFSIHDPTTLDRQGADVGTQYRSVVFYHDEGQAEAARAAIAAMTRDRVWPDPVVTQIEPLTTFYRAEDYHQDYYRNNRAQGYCQVVINPKLAKFRREFADHLK